MTTATRKPRRYLTRAEIIKAMDADANKPRSKQSLFRVLEAFLRDCYDDETVKIVHAGTTELRIRVAQDSGGPKYYRVKIVEEP